jgi:hypothetical protein
VKAVEERHEIITVSWKILGMSLREGDAVADASLLRGDLGALDRRPLASAI